MIKGRGGMGVRKHRQAGHPNRGGHFKMAVEAEFSRPKKTPRKPPMFATVKEAIAAAQTKEAATPEDDGSL